MQTLYGATYGATLQRAVQGGPSKDSSGSDAAARTRLVREGYDPVYGARPLKRAIQREVETPLAKKILGGEARDGYTVRLDPDPAGNGLRV